MGKVEEGGDCNGRRGQVEPASSVAADEQREAAFGCEAVVKSDTAVHQKKLAGRIDDCSAAERSLALLVSCYTAERRLALLDSCYTAERRLGVVTPGTA
ncbi:hypothetical protein ACQ4OB_26045 [Pseudomonas sp. ES4]|uniref:hypothetical protein n=1 Tax=Pseudomonas sp. ES4 TaxID=3424777 RepID=UPI003D3504C4